MKILKLVKNPSFYAIILYKKIRNTILARTNPRKLASVLYTDTMGDGKKINWEHPEDLNEKINWMKFNTETSMWTQLADKYTVREFVKDRIGEQYLVPLLGMWESENDIDFSHLPNSFVLKSNNGAGTILVIKDKSTIVESDIRKIAAKWLKKRFGLLQAEPHYLKIKPLIIAESLLNEDSSISFSLIDYKIWCFDGEVFGTWCCFNRNKFHADTEWHDLDWTFRPEWSKFSVDYKNGKGVVPKPKNYNKMLEIASKLSKGFPQVRVDLYNIDGEIYFGEMTFTAAGGHMNFYSDKILKIMGSKTKISNIL